MTWNWKMWLASLVVTFGVFGLAPPADAQMTDSVVRTVAKGIAAEVAGELDRQMQGKAANTVRRTVDAKLGWLRHILGRQVKVSSSVEYRGHRIKSGAVEVDYTLTARYLVNVGRGPFRTKAAAFSTTQIITVRADANGLGLFIDSTLRWERRASRSNAQALDAEIRKALRERVLEANEKVLRMLKR
jgi:hypothetical protein